MLPLMVRTRLSADLYNDVGVLMESVKALIRERKLQRAAAYQTLKCYDRSLALGINKTLSCFKKPAYLTLRPVTEHEVRVEVDMEGDTIIMLWNQKDDIYIDPIPVVSRKKTNKKQKTKTQNGQHGGVTSAGLRYR